jgi:hypothetical protein
MLSIWIVTVLLLLRLQYQSKILHFLFLVSKNNSKEGETQTLKFLVSRYHSKEGGGKIHVLQVPWKAEDQQRYYIYHFNGDKRHIIVRVGTNGSSKIKSSKYTVHRQSGVSLTVKNITRMDAGYYGVGSSQTAARSGPGVVLVVEGWFYCFI